MNGFVALIGYPIKHSISPAFQQASFDYYHLNIRYEKWEIESSGLKRAIDLLRQPSYLGSNVTIPYKEAVIPMLDSLDNLVVEIGAVNTIINRNGILSGYNTDAPAFIRALREEGGFEPEDKEAILLGAGGVARAAGLALLREKVKSLTIANRNLEGREASRLSK
jgi:shikimate dehydrogenase